MSDYVLRYLDGGGNVLLAEPIASETDGEAMAIVREMRLLVPSELWMRERLVCKFAGRSKLLVQSEG